MYRGYLYTDDEELLKELGDDVHVVGAMHLEARGLGDLKWGRWPRNATCVVTYGNAEPCLEDLRPWQRRIVKKFETRPTWADVARCTELTGLAQLNDPDYFAPKVSVIVASHDTEKFEEGPALQSLERQTFRDFELVLIGDGDEANYVEEADTWVVMPNVNRIGYLKGMAVAAARSEIIVELDHDDELMPDALKCIVEVFDGKPDVGFVYSKFAEVKADGTFNEYQSPLWNYKSVFEDGRWFRVADLHDVEGRYVVNGVDNPTIMHMGLCPNHVRAWRRSEYFKIGGYRDLPWCDDYDLMLRFRLRSSMRMYGIDELLYVQYIGNSTWVKDPAMLTRGMMSVQKTYAEELKQKLGATMI